MISYGYHWWLGSLVVLLCQVCLRALWWEKLKLWWDCLPWVSLLISGVWYNQKKCHLLPVSSILFWWQSSSAFSSISCTLAPHAYLLLSLAAFGSSGSSFEPQNPSLFAPLGVTLLTCLCDTFMNFNVTHYDVAITECRIHNVVCSISTELLYSGS